MASASARRCASRPGKSVAVAGIAYAVNVDDYGLVPYHLMLAFGFGAVCWYSVVHSLRTAG